MLSPDDPNLRVAVFGKQVQDFLDTDLGDYLLKCAKDESDRATEELKRADPFEAQTIANIQGRIKVAEYFITWLAHAVNAGLQATEHLREDA